jgi:NADPH-dependent 2,4-dienoyl-CoA reductase/sulfur reductase-like enzyme
MPHDAPIAGPKGIASFGVTLTYNARVREIDRVGRAVVTQAGARVPYDALVLATGSVNRVLPMFPRGGGVYYLRTMDEALALKEHLHRGQSLILIGGGVVGLEIAASAAELGRKVTVLEIAPRILARLCDEETSAMIHERHRAHGVVIRTGVATTGVRTLPDGKLAVDTKGGETFIGDLIVVGAGAVPEDSLAKAAGLTVQDGIVVDDHCRTSDPAIFAAGDCTRFPGPAGHARLENWRHAQEHGAVAGRNAAGGDVAYNVPPSFWSEQHDMYIQGMGWPIAAPTARVKRQIGPNAMIQFDLAPSLLSPASGGGMGGGGDHIAYAMGINAQRDIGATRRLIERRVPVNAADLADPAKPLNAMLKAKA